MTTASSSAQCVCFPFPIRQTFIEYVWWAGHWFGGSDYQGSDEQSVCMFRGNDGDVKTALLKGRPIFSGALKSTPGTLPLFSFISFLLLPLHQKPSQGDMCSHLLCSLCTSSCYFSQSFPLLLHQLPLCPISKTSDLYVIGGKSCTN